MDKISPVLSNKESQRYQQQMKVPEIGETGQQALKCAKVLCVGAGGLGSPLLLYLAAAGIGQLGIIDHDKVEINNLHRQILFTSQDIGQSKTVCAQSRLQALNPTIKIITHQEKLTETNALSLIGQYDIIVDGSDNFMAKYLINDACCTLEKPNVYASISQFEGQCSVFMPSGPCYRCLFPYPPQEMIPNCQESGVIGSLPGILGTIQATEVIKLIVGQGENLSGRLLTLDALSMQFHTYQFTHQPTCPCCIEKKSFDSLSEKRTERQYTTAPVITATQLIALLQQQDNEMVLLDVREPDEHKIKNLGGVLMPISSFTTQQHQSFNPTQSIVVYCATGSRSAKVVKLLRQEGYQAVSLQGGLAALSEEECLTTIIIPYY